MAVAWAGGGFGPSVTGVVAFLVGSCWQQSQPAVNVDMRRGVALKCGVAPGMWCIKRRYLLRQSISAARSRRRLTGLQRNLTVAARLIAGQSAINEEETNEVDNATHRRDGCRARDQLLRLPPSAPIALFEPPGAPSGAARCLAARLGASSIPRRRPSTPTPPA